MTVATTTTNPQSVIDQIVRLTFDIADGNKSLHGQWWNAVRGASAVDLVEVTALLPAEPSDPVRASRIKALREAIISEIECKNTQKQIDTMEKLDAATTRLSCLSILLTVVGLLLAAAQLIPLIQGWLENS